MCCENTVPQNSAERWSNGDLALAEMGSRPDRGATLLRPLAPGPQAERGVLMNDPRPTYALVLEALPWTCPPAIRLRRLLKVLLRCLGFRCVSIQESGRPARRQRRSQHERQAAPPGSAGQGDRTRPVPGPGRILSDARRHRGTLT